MKRNNYILIFLVIGALAGLIYGFSYSPTCPVNSLTGEISSCMGDPKYYAFFGLIGGSIAGAVVGLILGLIFNRKK